MTTMTPVAIDLDRVAEPWEDLYARTPGATPFQSYGWLRAYWSAFGDASSLRLVCSAAPGGRLTGAMALRRRRRTGMTVLTSLGDELSDFTDVLLDPAEPNAAEGLAEALVATPGWDVVDLPEVPPGAVLQRLLDVWPGQHFTHPAATCLELPVAPVDELVGRLPAKSREVLRRQQRREAALPLREERVPAEPEELTRAVGQLLDLHAEQWAGRPINRLHLAHEYRRHLTEAAQLLVPAGRMALTRHELDGELVAVNLFLIGPDAVSGYLYGIAPKLFRQLDVSAMAIRSGLELCRSHGVSRLAMLRGEEPGKLRWQPRRLRNRRVLLVRPEFGRGHAAVLGALALRAGRARAARSPRLVRLAAALTRRGGDGP